MTPLVISVIFGYFLGSVPFGFLVARANGVDIRNVGSGNIGATNVLRTLGKGWGILTLVLDMLKGLLPVLFAGWLISNLFPEQGQVILPAKILAGVSAILGHSFSCFLKFKGGKGVATSAGVMLGLAPLLVLIGLVVFISVFLLSRMVSLSSMTAGVVIAVCSYLPMISKGHWYLPATFTFLAVLVIFRHRANIQRILNGTESKFTRKKVDQ